MTISSSDGYDKLTNKSEDSERKRKPINISVPAGVKNCVAFTKMKALNSTYLPYGLSDISSTSNQEAFILSLNFVDRIFLKGNGYVLKESPEKRAFCLHNFSLIHPDKETEVFDTSIQPHIPDEKKWDTTFFLNAHQEKVLQRLTDFLEARNGSELCMHVILLTATYLLAVDEGYSLEVTPYIEKQPRRKNRSYSPIKNRKKLVHLTKTGT